MARSAGEEGLNHQVVSFKSPADTPKCPECCGNHGFCAAVPVVRIHLPPAESQQRWLIVSSAIAQESSTAIAIRSRSADRGGRVAPPAADPSQATGRVKGRINQLHRARVLEVRIQSPPAASQQTFGSSQDDARCSTIGRKGLRPARRWNSWMPTFGPSGAKPKPLSPGTEGSNPALSSGESVANSIWAKAALPMRLPPRLLGFY